MKKTIGFLGFCFILANTPSYSVELPHEDFTVLSNSCPKYKEMQKKHDGIVDAFHQKFGKNIPQAAYMNTMRVRTELRKLRNGTKCRESSQLYNDRAADAYHLIGKDVNDPVFDLK